MWRRGCPAQRRAVQRVRSSTFTLMGDHPFLKWTNRFGCARLSACENPSGWQARLGASSISGGEEARAMPPGALKPLSLKRSSRKEMLKFAGTEAVRPQSRCSASACRQRNRVCYLSSCRTSRSVTEVSRDKLRPARKRKCAKRRKNAPERLSAAPCEPAAHANRKQATWGRNPRRPSDRCSSGVRARTNPFGTAGGIQNLPCQPLTVTRH